LNCSPVGVPSRPLAMAVQAQHDGHVRVVGPTTDVINFEHRCAHRRCRPLAEDLAITLAAQHARRIGGGTPRRTIAHQIESDRVRAGHVAQRPES
jgi:hypothetical protein